MLSIDGNIEKSEQPKVMENNGELKHRTRTMVKSVRYEKVVKKRKKKKWMAKIPEARYHTTNSTKKLVKE